MKKPIQWMLALTIAITSYTNISIAHEGPQQNHQYANYQVSKEWLRLADGRHAIGKSHGEIDVAKDGKFYVSIMSDKDIKGGIQVYSPEGEYLTNVPNAPDDFHSFVIKQDTSGTEYIYGSGLKSKHLIKMTLDGTIVLNIDAVKEIPSEFHNKGTYKNGHPKPKLKLTALEVDSEDNLYVVDGYSLDYIHKFDAKGNYLSTFGGKDSPYKFNNCHKIHVDPRFQPNRLICTDRKNARLVHMTLDGALIGTYADNLRRPSSVDFYGDIAAVAEISGRVSLLDKNGNTIKTLGTNNVKAEINTNITQPDKWRNGVFTAPHGITFDHKGDLFITEWNKWGRIVRFDLQKQQKK